MIVFISLYFSIFLHTFFPVYEPVKIGLLIADKSRIGQEAIDATQVAFNEANKNGGYNGRPFELIVRSCEGPWGVGSKASVDLVYEDEVWAILGSLDGRNAHLAEQVTAKSQVVFMSTRASDPSLSRAYVPWYFRVIPDDLQQAHALIKAMVNKQHEQSILILTTEEYDAKSGAEVFLKTAVDLGIMTPKLFNIQNDHSNDDELLSKVNEQNLSAIVLYGAPVNYFSILKKIKSIQTEVQVYASSSAFSDLDELTSHPELSENLAAVSPNFWYTVNGKNFINNFKSTYGYSPGIIGAYAHDGALLMIRVIRMAGLNKQNICNELKRTVFDAPLIGTVSFDQHGNTRASTGMIRIKEGRPSPYK